MTVGIRPRRSEPETGYSGLGTGAGVFSINAMNFGDVVYVISDLELFQEPPMALAILLLLKRPLAFKFHPHERLVDNPIHRKSV
jgi:hypothetical protein